MAGWEPKGYSVQPAGHHLDSPGSEIAFLHLWKGLDQMIFEVPLKFDSIITKCA